MAISPEYRNANRESTERRDEVRATLWPQEASALGDDLGLHDISQDGRLAFFAQAKLVVQRLHCFFAVLVMDDERKVQL